MDKDNISLTECGGITAVQDVVTVLKHFDIPCYVLVDEDPGNAETERRIEELRSLLGDDFVLLQSPNLQGLFGLARKPNKKEALDLFPQWFIDNEVQQVYEELKRKILGP